ncbi:unnamed protein product [Gadus morhua 'NCC']
MYVDYFVCHIYHYHVIHVTVTDALRWQYVDVSSFCNATAYGFIYRLPILTRNSSSPFAEAFPVSLFFLSTFGLSLKLHDTKARSWHALSRPEVHGKSRERRKGKRTGDGR